MTFRGVVGFFTAVAVVVAISSQTAAHDKPWPVPEAAKKMANPVKSTPAAAADAKRTYVKLCEQCHGEKGKGDGPEAMMYTVKPANFSDAHMMAEMTDGEIFYKMTEGRQPMPSFKKQLTDEQRWHLVHFVRTFATRPAAGKAPAKKAEPAHKH
jgi:mono/diheme cytochrome c family protein